MGIFYFFSLLLMMIAFLTKQTESQEFREFLRIQEWTYTQAQPLDPAIEIRALESFAGSVDLRPFSLRFVSNSEEFTLQLFFVADALFPGQSAYLFFRELQSQTSGSLALLAGDQPAGQLPNPELMVDFVAWGAVQNHYLIASAINQSLWNAPLPVFGALLPGFSYHWSGVDSGPLGQSQDADFSVRSSSLVAPLVAPICNLLDGNHFGSINGYDGCEIPDGVQSDVCSQISTVPLPFLSLSDEEELSIPLDFSFHFFGSTYSSVTLGSNGYLAFADSPNLPTQTNCPLPTGAVPVIAAGWDNLNPAQGGTVRAGTAIVGTRPRFVVEFADVPRFGNTNYLVSFSAMFEAGTNEIVICSARNSEGVVGIRGLSSLSAPRCGRELSAYAFQLETANSDSSDTLSSSAIIGIILGSIFGCLLIALIFGIVTAFIVDASLKRKADTKRKLRSNSVIDLSASNITPSKK